MMPGHIHKCNIFGRPRANLLALNADGHICALRFRVYVVTDVNFIEVEPLISVTVSHPGQT